MDAPKVTARYHPARWTEAELNAWIDANTWAGASEETKVKNGLSNWIQAATKGLSPAGTAQVEAEVRARVEQETSRLEINGLNEITALKQAIALLGDPKIAKKEYESIYLSSQEAARLNRMTHITVGNIFLLAYIALYSYLIFSQKENKAQVLVIYSFWVSGLSDTVFGILGRLLRIPTRSTLLLSMCVNVVLGIVSVVEFYAAGGFGLKSASTFWHILSIFLLMLSLVGIFELFRSTIRLIHKLERGAV